MSSASPVLPSGTREVPKGEQLDTAVLLLAFNRPAETKRVFDAIRRVRPKRLYVAADGPRADREADAALCADVRRIVTSVDWPCSVKTLFQDRNLGCKRGVGTALDWFFAAEESGIVLEDDCLPSVSFFRFCEELLGRFRDEQSVFSIQGTFFGSHKPPAASYTFSKMFHMWGWASWANRWRAVNLDELDLPRIRRSILSRRWFGRSPLLQRYWIAIADLQAAGQVDSWGYSALFHCVANELLHATPARNLVLNIGTGTSATTTVQQEFGPCHRDALEMEFPLAHQSPDADVADALLPFELRWRINLTARRLWREVLRSAFPRFYAHVRGAILWLQRQGAAGR